MTKERNGKRRNSKKHMRNIVIGFLLIYFVYSMVMQEAEIRRKQDELAQVEQQIAAEQKKQEALKKSKEEAVTPEYMEELAREQLGYVLPDEIIFMGDSKNN